jgi:cysteinyl-tRNA synthetase
MTLQVYNSLTRQKEVFTPLHEGRVGMYVCGPTVYGHAHLGHAKSYVSFDVMVRYLRYLGFRVRYVQNITDVGHLTDDADAGEDKILKKARLDQVEPMEVVELYMRSYFEDMDALNVLRPDISPRATAHIPEMLDLIESLMATGHAYEANGSVYFSVESFSGYGRLSGRRVEDQEEGARVEVNAEKRNPADFALWKRAEPGHLLQWRSPWGRGFPGWHIECSVMSTKYLGQPFDIHGGGLENQFPHHESEIAQSEAAFGQPFAHYWLHNNMVTVNGVKMGKSLGNFITLKDAFTRYAPLVVRFFVLSSHYRSPIDFSEGALEAAARGLERLHGAVKLVEDGLARAGAPAGSPDPTIVAALEEVKGRFVAAMDDDFNTAVALSVLFDLARQSNTWINAGAPLSAATLAAIQAQYRALAGDVLGVLPAQFGSSGEKAGLLEPLLDLLVELRQDARKSKDFARADRIRNRLNEVGVALEDGSDGTRWRVR